MTNLAYTNITDDEFNDIFSKLSLEKDDDKNKIIKLFYDNVKGKKFNKKENKHCGSEGHWLEKQFGVKPNSKKDADIYGYELKKGSKKITFGDWSANEYIFKPSKIINKVNEDIPCITKNEFLEIFGTPNDNGRYSWSGSCVPKYGKYNVYGQALVVDKDNNIYAIYRWSMDKHNKNKPEWCQTYPYIILAFWSNIKMEKHVNNKFNSNGFIICEKDKKNIYNKMYFGKKISFDYWMDNLKKGIIIFDSGMYQGNSRLYSQWRSCDSFWKNLIIEEYE